MGLLFDKQLTCAPTLDSLQHSCHKPLDLLSHLSHASWSADHKTILRLYKSLVHSKLYCMSSVYSSAAASQLRHLDPIQSEGLSLATDAFQLLTFMRILTFPLSFCAADSPNVRCFCVFRPLVERWKLLLFGLSHMTPLIYWPLEDLTTR